MSRTSLPQWVIKGITDECTTCECCGRSNLKRTVALAPLDPDGNEDGEPAYYGTGCAAAALGRTHTWVSNTAAAAANRSHSQDTWARRLISVYAPVEFATTREKAAAWFSRNPYREGSPGASVQIATLLRSARTQLQDTTLGPARPHTIADFLPHWVATGPDRSNILQAFTIPTAEGAEDERTQLHRTVREHARKHGGHVVTVYALDAQSAEDVAHAHHARAQYTAQRAAFH
ncbi:hypothetical protein AB0O57_29630 [Streptomyces sp. NPDC091201]|uniref:hypothetical protein n=1 Tax=Streptomyces sp. NPDC091201 TaxID=3155190 RepID=UPI00343DCC8A